MAIAAEQWIEAQHGVLGAMLIDEATVPIVLSATDADDFSGQCRTVYQAIRAIFSANQPVDPVVVVDKLGKDYFSFVRDLMEITPTAANVKSYIALAKKQARITKLRDIGQRMADCDTLEELQELLSKAVSLNTDRRGIRAVNTQDALADFYERHSVEKPPEYLKWSIDGLNDQLYIDKGDFMIIGGKPSSGKTAFALQCAWEQAKTKKVGFFSIETSVRKLFDRQMAGCAGVPMENIKRNALNENHWQAVTDFAMGDGNRRNLELISQSGLSISDIQAYSAARGYDVIYIDYLQLLQSSGKTRYEQVTNLSLDLHRFSQTSGCTVIGLSQLSRENAASTPDMGSLRESGQLEQDADAVLLLYLQDDNCPQGPRVLKCAKNKEGERFKILLDFDGKYQRFSKAQQHGEQFRNGMAKLNKERRAASKQMKFSELPDDLPVPFEA